MAPPVAEEITVALAGQAAADLASLEDRTGLSRTDAVNRAVSLYEFIDAQMSSGAEILVRRDGETHLLRLL